MPAGASRIKKSKITIKSMSRKRIKSRSKIRIRTGAAVESFSFS